MSYMPVVSESFQEPLDDGSFAGKSEGFQVKTQGLIDTKTLEGECAARKTL